MLRHLTAALLTVALAPAALVPAALAEDSTCEITYVNNSGTNFDGDATLNNGETMQVGDTTYTNAKGNTYPFTLDNNNTIVILTDESKHCELETNIHTSDEESALLSSVEAGGDNGSSTKCEENDSYGFDKYGCSCSDNKGSHDAKITMTCVGES